MKEEVSQSLNLMKNKALYFKWAAPLIESLEIRNRHSSIQWVIECLNWASDQWSIPNRNSSKELLDGLTELITDRKVNGLDKDLLVDKIEGVFNSLWFHNENRDDLVTCIANVYAAEGAFLLGDYQGYMQKLILLMGVGFQEEKSTSFIESFRLESIKKYEEFYI